MTEPTTSRDAWTELDRRTGYDNQISELNKTTIVSMNRTEGHLSIAELISNMSWTAL